MLAQAVLEAISPKEFLKKMKASGVLPWDEWEDLEDWQREAASLAQHHLSTQLALENHDDYKMTVRNADGEREWVIYKDEDEAEADAIRQVRDQLINEPELFTPSWLENHIDTDRLARNLYSDEHSSTLDRYQDEYGGTDDERMRDFLIDKGYLDEDDFKVGDENAPEEPVEPEEPDEPDPAAYETEEAYDQAYAAYENAHAAWEEAHDAYEEAQEAYDEYDPDEWKPIDGDLEAKIDSALEELVDREVEEQLSDPVQYLKDMLGDEDGLKQAVEIGGIDYDDAAQDAVSEDGFAHFLSPYDGNYDELDNGAIIMRLN